jgi:tungstate transport system substrate-binding protein
MLKLFTYLCLSFLIVANAVAKEIKTVPSQALRLAIVNTPAYSGLIEFLVRDFKQQSGLDVEITNSSDVFTIARSGQADIVIAHYGKADLEEFVLDGYGEWPTMVFSNQAALIGPKDDPAKVKNLQNTAEGFARIAQSKSVFIASPQLGLGYLTDMLWYMAGSPDKNQWFISSEGSAGQVAQLAEKRQAYFIWGAIPFLKYKQKHGSSLEILISHDSILQRIMCSMVVNPNTISGTTSFGAQQCQAYLVRPETQARIAAVRTTDSDQQLWWPAGRDN